MDHAGVMAWGPGGSTAQDTTLLRNQAGILQLGTTTQSGSLFLFGSAAGTNELATFVAAEAQARWALTADGTMSWGPGGAGARDTTLARSSAGILNVNAKTVEASTSGSQAGGTTWTPSLGNGFVQRVNVTSTGTLTIGSPGTPPANTSALLLLIIHNASGGTITLSWNASFGGSALPTAPANGAGIVSTFYYNPGLAKWCLAANGAE